MADSIAIQNVNKITPPKMLRLNKASSHAAVQTNTGSLSSNSVENNSSPLDFVGNIFKGIGNFFGSIFKGTFGWIIDAALSPIKFLIGAATLIGITYLLRKPLGNFLKVGQRLENLKTFFVKSIKNSFKAYESKPSQPAQP
ncbi:MAG: hypothetical protein ACK481_00135 [Candidatus Melainabacteria bacterium]|jgi:hypothetical protein